MNVKTAMISTLLIWLVLAYLSPKRQPIPEGGATVYWEFACGVELSGFEGYFPFAKETGIFPEQEGWYFFYFREHHGRHVYKIKEESLLATVPELFTVLDHEVKKTIQRPNRYDDLVAKNERRLYCRDIRDAVNADIDQFLVNINSNANNQNHQYLSEGFKRQINRAKMYWVSVVFEVSFIPLWWLFSFHPGVFGRWNQSRVVRSAFSPLLLFTPYFLGYANHLFTFCPSGGILYPLFVLLFCLPFMWLPFNFIDQIILLMIPRPLFSISQFPVDASVVTFYGGISPTLLILYIFLVFKIGASGKKQKGS